MITIALVTCAFLAGLFAGAAFTVHYYEKHVRSRLGATGDGTKEWQAFPPTYVIDGGGESIRDRHVRESRGPRAATDPNFRRSI